MTHLADVTVVLLAGGTGARMNASIPKQYLQIQSKPIARYSFDVFLNIPEVAEIIVVCDPSYRQYFHGDRAKPAIHFALPGERRQDSVWNGFQCRSPGTRFVCIHDSARPMIDESIVHRVLEAARTHGAATVGMPVKFTVKESYDNRLVKHTPDRQKIWEIQTPQVIRSDLLAKGFAFAQENNLTVTDDVSLVELFGHPVKLVEGSHTNLKITTPEDLLIAECLIKNA